MPAILGALCTNVPNEVATSSARQAEDTCGNPISILYVD
jgi:hypothetical protein